MNPSTSLGTRSNVGMAKPSPPVRQAGNIGRLLVIHGVCRRSVPSRCPQVKYRCRCRVKALRAINPPVHAGEFNGGLNLTKNNTALQFGLVDNTLFGFSQFAISGSDLGIGNTGTPFDLFSQDNVVFAPSAIPEPSSLTLLLLGTSVLGLSAIRRCKRRP